jgi:hypothetical protein
MKNPATMQNYSHFLILDADPQPLVFSYSTLDRPSRGEKAQIQDQAGGTGALEDNVKKSKR